MLPGLRGTAGAVPDAGQAPPSAVSGGRVIPVVVWWSTMGRRRWDGELVTVEHNKETLNARVLYDFFLSFGTAYRID